MTTQPTSEMIEAVAKAIHADRQKHGLSGEASWDFEPDQIREIYRSSAKAAIAAMGEFK